MSHRPPTRLKPPTNPRMIRSGIHIASGGTIVHCSLAFRFGPFFWPVEQWSVCPGYYTAVICGLDVMAMSIVYLISWWHAVFDQVGTKSKENFKKFLLAHLKVVNHETVRIFFHWPFFLTRIFLHLWWGRSPKVQKKTAKHKKNVTGAHGPCRIP